MNNIKYNPDTIELGITKPHLVVQIIKFIPNPVVKKSIVKKVIGDATVKLITTCETIKENTLAFDTFIQIIEGEAEVIINKNKHPLKLGNGMIIPANTKHSINGNEQFKMIATIIKRGYEDISIAMM